MKNEADMTDSYGTLGNCMWTLLISGTFMDAIGDHLTALKDKQKLNTTFALLLFFSFMFLSAITVMNILIGVLCEVVSEVARGEKDDNEIRLIKEHILVELMKFDDDGDGMVSKSELERVIRNPRSIAVFR